MGGIRCGDEGDREQDSDELDRVGTGHKMPPGRTHRVTREIRVGTGTLDSFSSAGGISTTSRISMQQRSVTRDGPTRFETTRRKGTASSPRCRSYSRRNAPTCWRFARSHGRPLGISRIACTATIESSFLPRRLEKTDSKSRCSIGQELASRLNLPSFRATKKTSKKEPVP